MGDHGILLADVFLTRRCNYRCSYCLYRNEPPVGEEVLSSPDVRSALIEFFNKRGRWVIALTGGEPSQMPGFISFCRAICERHYLALITNLSFPVEELVESVASDRVKYIQCSFQEEAESRVEAFLLRCIRLKECGFPVKVAFPAAPARISNVPTYHRLFAERGIDFFIQPYFGMEQGRLYPRDYSPADRTLLSRSCLGDNFLLYVLNDGPFRRSTGRPCLAGHGRICVNAVSGDIHPCSELTHIVLGNVYQDRLDLYRELRPCPSMTCVCSFDEETARVHGELARVRREPFPGMKYIRYREAMAARGGYDDHWRSRAEVWLKHVFDGYERVCIYGSDLSEVKILDFLERYGYLDRVSCLVRRDRPTGEPVYRHLRSLHPDDLGAVRPDLILVAAANSKPVDAFLRRTEDLAGTRIVHYNETLELDP